jgi:hypothetical protein
MMNGKMKKLALALGLALGSTGLMQSAQAVHVSAENLGQALIFPYYTVRGGWTTLFGITNTSNLVVTAKVRFREAYNSRDVFDFVIVLSPHDVWTGWVADAGDRPAIFTEDTSCTVGFIPSTGQPFLDGLNTYTGPTADGGPTTPDRMKEGYVEVIMMGAAQVVTPAPVPDPTPLARGAIHVNGATPPGCNNLTNAFLDYAQLPALRAEFNQYAVDPTSTPPGRPLNPLKGTFALVNGPEGFNAVGLPVHLANFSTGVSVLGAPMLTAQLPQIEAGNVFADSYNEPSLFSSNTVGEYLSSAGLAALPGRNNANATVVNVTGALEATNVINEWSRRTNAAAGWVTATDWVITFPTKSFYVDNDANNEFAGRNVGRANNIIAPGLIAANLTPFTQSFVDTAATPVVRRGQSCDVVSFILRNREEQRSQAAGFSPGGAARLCYETNVLTFNQAAILNSPIASSINYPENFTFGWLDVRFAGANALNRGLPAVGFAITTRDDGASELLSEAAAYDHSIVRPQP